MRAVALLACTCFGVAHSLARVVHRRQVIVGLAAVSALPFRAAASDETVVTTVLKEGDPSSPTPQRAQKAVVDYTLWINDFEGQQIDTSRGTLFPIPRPPSPFAFNVGVGEVIPGWDRVVRTMHVGDKRRVVIPAGLGYGAKGIGPIPGNANVRERPPHHLPAGTSCDLMCLCL